MRILDKDGNEIFDPDYTKGYTEEETIVIAHHEGTPATEDVFHYEEKAVYRNRAGHIIGRDMEKVIDTPGQEATDPWDETENILRWHDFTEDDMDGGGGDDDTAKLMDILLGVDDE